VGPAWVGDMVMAQSLFKIIKQYDSLAQIEVLAPAWSQGLLERMPQVSGILSSPFGHGELQLNKRYRLGKSLRQKAYDQVILIPNSLKSALTPYWAHIPQRTGFYGEWPRSYLLNDGRYLDKKRYPLMFQRFVSLGLPANAPLPEHLPWPQLIVDPKKRDAALEKYGLIINSNQPLMIIAPGAEFGPSKRWPASYFAEVAKEKIKQNWQVWLLGSTRDQTISQELNDFTGGRCQDLTGKTTLAEAIDFLSLASIVVSNDSGLMHIAAALQKPIVAIYGSTPADITPPLAHHTESLYLDLSCRPCMQRECPLGHWRCMRDLKPEKVLASIDTLYKGNQ